MSKFGLAVVKREGDLIEFGDAGEYTPRAYSTVYVERRVPVDLEQEAHALMDTFLREKGFDPDEV